MRSSRRCARREARSASRNDSIVARIVSAELTNQLGQNFFVENQPGANGIVGANTVAKAAPDGYTLLVYSSGFVVNPYVQKQLPYDTEKDFAPVTNLTSSGGLFLAVNADNLYPLPALEALRQLHGPGLAGFRRSGLLRGGLIAAERILAFALIEADPDGFLSRIVEKPDPAAAASFGPDPLVSMNAWVLPPSIFESARAIAPSVRGELELQDAVRHNIHELGERYRVLPFDEPVVDLSSRSDIPVVTRLLQDREVLP